MQLHRATLPFLASVGLSFLSATGANAQDFAPPACIEKYSFYPQAGNFFEDAFPGNFVDLDSSSGVRDWNCGDYSYDGHNGIDTGIRGGFAGQAIGVPVFAILDGTVNAAHDGEFDMQTSFVAGAEPNYVSLDHGGGHVTQYVHLKKGSVAVSVGQQVKAGQQLGLVASSGTSTAPHLHFTSYYNWVAFESFAGSCRGGISNWVAQPVFRTDPYLREFVITNDDLTGWKGPNFDTSRTGTFYTGTRTVRFWFWLANAKSVTKYQIRYLRPDGSVAVDGAPGPLNGGRDPAYYFNYTVNLNVPGTWHIEVLFNDQLFTRAPFTVISSGEIVNRPPGGVQAAFDPPAPIAGDVIFCRVTLPTFFLDPDYALPRFRYVWKVNGAVVRDVANAALSDAIPRNSADTGDTITCTVTPSDGIADGPSTTASVTIAAATAVADNLLNISTRLGVATGDRVLIAGMIATGAEPKKVLLRAIGPSLATTGVQDALPDTTLDLFSGETLVATNDDWNTSAQRAEIEASGIAPASSVESALIATLEPNQPYSAVLRGKDGATGIALVEAYDLEQGAPAQLANISTRGFIETGERVLIAGFIIGGERSGGATVAVRALGPSLANGGVANPLANPELQIFDGNGVLRSVNDDWKECQRAEITATGLQPSNDRESTIIAKLPPGPYTALVRSNTGNSGVGLVEVYNLK